MAPITTKGPSQEFFPDVEYRPENYRSLPLLAEAAERFERKRTHDQITGEIRQLFLDRQMHEEFAIVLLHRRAGVSVGQHDRLVFSDDGPRYDERERYNASPLRVGRHPEAVVRMISHVWPRSWRVAKELIVPYDFYLTEREPEEHLGHLKFLREVAALLRRLDLHDVLGVRSLHLYSPERPLETVRKHNGINAVVTHARLLTPVEELQEVMWVFSPDGDEGRQPCTPVYAGEAESDQALVIRRQGTGLLSRIVRTVSCRGG